MNLPSKDRVADATRNTPHFRSGYLFGLGDAASVILDHMKHADSLEEVQFGQAIIAVLKEIGASI